MIYYFVTKAFSNTIHSFLATWGKALKPCVRVIDYPRAFRQRRFYPGTYIFSDLERLSVTETEWAAAIYNATTDRWGESTTILNHPTRSARRYELLRSLYSACINSHNVIRLTELRCPDRYPVFIRGADDHGGAATALLHSESELLNAIEKMNRLGISREDKIIVEFCDTADKTGIYRKYSAFIINGTIIPRHVCFSRDWQVKFPDLATPAIIDEEHDYITGTRHHDELRRIFTLANISYGRIDYSVHNGKIQVWEINTNPRIASHVSAENPARRKTQDLFVGRYIHAMEALDSRNSVAADWVRNPVRKHRLISKVLEQAKHVGESLLFKLPLSPKTNGAIREKLVAVKNRIQNLQ